jgi:hypothetical protein
MAADKIVLRPEPYDPDAIDADGDGIVQERTPWERPGGTRLLDAAGNAIEKGRSLTSRPAGMRVVRSDGKEVNYVPTYATEAPSAGGTALSARGAPSLAERGAGSVREIQKPIGQYGSILTPGQKKNKEKYEAIFKEAGDRVANLPKKDRDRRESLVKQADELLAADIPDPQKRKAVAIVSVDGIEWALDIDTQKPMKKMQLLSGALDGPVGDVPEAIYKFGGNDALAVPLRELHDEMNLSNREVEAVAEGLFARFRKRKVKKGSLSPDDSKQLSDSAAKVKSGLFGQKKQTLDDISIDMGGADKPDVPEAPKTSGDPRMDSLLGGNPKADKKFLKDAKRGKDGLLRSEAAEKFIHEDGGDIESIPDEILIETMFDSNIKADPNSPFRSRFDLDSADEDVDITKVLGGDRMFYAFVSTKHKKLENDRFSFLNVKDTPSDQYGVWTVWWVTDKKTGKDYFIKASQYGADEALNEKLGDDIIAAAGFDFIPESRLIHAQQESVNIANKGNMRWVMMPHVKQSTVNPKDGMTGEPTDFKDIVGQIPARQEAMSADFGALAVVDYLTNNLDRHGANLTAYEDADGAWHLIPIDHGLMFGGRYGSKKIGGSVDVEKRREEIVTTLQQQAEVGPSEFFDGMNQVGNVINSLFRGQNGSAMGVSGSAYEIDTDVAYKSAQETIARLEAINPDELFSPARLKESSGMVLNPDELAHMEAAKTVFVKRLAALKADLDKPNPSIGLVLGRKFDNDAEYAMSAADQAALEASLEADRLERIANAPAPESPGRFG